MQWTRPSAASFLLGGLLGLLALAVLTADRSDWPGFIGDESTYLMAAESLAWDFDYRYGQRDFERFVDHWGRRSELLLFLQSKDHGETIVYGKPFFYPLLAAPLVRLAPRHGALLLNLILLGLAAWVALRALRPLHGRAAAAWVALFVFGSVAWAYAFWAHADLFLLSLVAIGLGLALEGAPDGRAAAAPRAARWIAVGVCLAIVGFSRPFYLPLFLPALLAARRRPWARTAMLAAAVLVAGAAAVVHWRLAGTLTAYTGDRSGFYARTGLPAVDFPAADWDRAAAESGVTWHEARQPLALKADAHLWGWNALYLLAGRHVGLLPYFAPLLLGLVGRPRGRERWGLLIAVAASVGALFLYRAFNFYGGGAAIGNRYFLPLYPAFWFLAAKPVRPRWAAAVALASAPFLWPVWTQPGAYPLAPDLTYRLVSPAARALLPFETTQSHLKPGGQEDVRHRGLWIRFLTPAARPAARQDSQAEWLEVATGRRGELLIAAPAPIERLDLAVRTDADLSLEVAGAELLGRAVEPAGPTFALRLDAPRATHPMWWTWDRLYLYVLRIRFEGGPIQMLRFALEWPAGAAP